MLVCHQTKRATVLVQKGFEVAQGLSVHEPCRLRTVGVGIVKFLDCVGKILRTERVVPGSGTAIVGCGTYGNHRRRSIRNEGSHETERFAATVADYQVTANATSKTVTREGVEEFDHRHILLEVLHCFDAGGVPWRFVTVPAENNVIRRRDVGCRLAPAFTDYGGHRRGVVHDRNRQWCRVGGTNHCDRVVVK